MQLNDKFISCLAALRSCLLHCGASVGLLFFLMAYWAKDFFRIFAKPLLQVLPKDGAIIVTDVTGSFLIPMKVTAMLAFILALPYILHHIWLFISPALYNKEKQLALPLLITSYLLFIFGIIFAYFIVFPKIFYFMAQYNIDLGAKMTTDIEKYLDFAMSTFLIFGCAFEVPVIVVGLIALNVVSRSYLQNLRPYIIVGSFVIAAILTPPDILSQLLLAIPLCLLFELGLLISKYLPYKKISTKTS